MSFIVCMCIYIYSIHVHDDYISKELHNMTRTNRGGISSNKNSQIWDTLSLFKETRSTQF